MTAVFFAQPPAPMPNHRRRAISSSLPKPARTQCVNLRCLESTPYWAQELRLQSVIDHGQLSPQSKMAPIVISDLKSPSSDPSSASQYDESAPFRVNDNLKARDIGTSTNYSPGHSIVNPSDIHNVGFFILFALLGLGFVVSAIWFFFWAKNGGFHFRKGDWSEYKSTVLRRKGPDGKTLSNATKSTKLGGGSVVGSEYTDTSFTSYRDSEHGEEQEDKRKKKRRHKKANRYDADVREYRAEKPARVGGINKQPDSHGTVLDYSTAASNLSGSQSAMSEVSRHQPSKHPRRDFSFNHGSEASFSVVASEVSSNAPLRPQERREQASRYHTRDQPQRHSSSAKHPTQYKENRARRSQGFYASRAGEGSYHEPIDFRDEARGPPSEAQVRNTKSYKHNIPGLSKGPAGAGSGFRRGGGGGRRDSLSDSDGDETYMS